MSKVSVDCNVVQGYDFRKDVTEPVGYMTELVIGGQTLPVDQTTIKDPQNPDTLLGSGVVAVLSKAKWETGPADPMHFEGKISAASAQTIKSYLAKVTDVSVKFKFCVYAYDPVARKMFKSFNSGDAEMKGQIVMKSGQLWLSLDPTGSAFTIEIAPAAGLLQQVQLATSDIARVTKMWG